MSEFREVCEIRLDLYCYVDNLGYEKYRDRRPGLFDGFMEQFNFWREEYDVLDTFISFPENVDKEKYPELSLVLEHILEDYKEEYPTTDIKELVLEVYD